MPRRPYEWTGPDLPTLPDEIYALRDAHERHGATESDGKRDLDVLGTRDDILTWLGGLAAYAGMTEAEYLALLRAAREGGRIVDLDESRPWTNEDLATLAREAARWRQGDMSAMAITVRKVRRVAPRRYSRWAPEPPERWGWMK